MVSFIQQMSEVRERATGKWQIPAFVLSVAALGIAIATYRSPLDKVPFDEMAAELPALIERGSYTAAIRSASTLLQVPKRTVAELSPVHAHLARTLVLRAKRSGLSRRRAGKAAIEHYAEAVASRYRLMPEDHELLGHAFDWLGDYASALSHYDDAIASLDQPAIAMRRRALELRLAAGLAPSEQLHGELDGLVADAGDDAELLVWAADAKVELLCDEGRADEAGEFLVEVTARVQDAPWDEWLEYLSGYVLYRSGSYDEGESALRLLRNRLEVRDELFARTGWLLGRLVLGEGNEGRPEEALTFFRNVASGTASPVYQAASELGMAEALVTLERFDEALNHYRAVIRQAKKLGPGALVGRAAIESSLILGSELLRRKGELTAAVQLADLATAVDSQLRGESDGRFAAGSLGVVSTVSPLARSRRAMLLERLAGLKAALARKKREQAEVLSGSLVKPPSMQRSVPSPSRGGALDGDASVVEVELGLLRADARRLLLEAGEAMNEVARLETMDEERAEQAAWRGGELIDESGDAAATVAAMRAFLEDHPASAMLPRALLRLGRSNQALGRYQEAVEAYQENLCRYPRTPDAGSGLVPLARCFMAMGPQFADQANKTLRVVLEESRVFTPRAPEYADALFLSGDLLNRQGEFERAIGVLEEAIERYPEDRRVPLARFLLAECYRQSGVALAADFESAPTAGAGQRLLLERKSRLRTAAGLFEQIVSDYEERDSSTLGLLDHLYLRHARLYEADCLFELKEYQEAAKLYERAAWVYKDSASALAAYVQIINCHLFLGQGEEAAAALRRGQYLVRTLPDDAFEGPSSLESRADWQDLFDWMATAELF